MSHLTLEYVLQFGQGRERVFLCPSHQDSNPSASVNVEKGVWFCYACGARGRLDGVADTTPDELVTFVTSLLDSETESARGERWLDVFDAGPVHPYWLSRFSELACRHFRLGYDSYVGEPCYPIRDPAGRPLGLVHRALSGSVRYRYPRGIKISDYLFNYSSAQRDIVVLVEGATDVIATWDVGADAFGMFGSRLSQAQLNLLRRIDPKLIVLATDMDDAGKACARAISSDLSDEGYLTERLSWPALWGKDLSALDIERRHAVLEHLVPASST